MMQTEAIKYQLVPPHIHRRNAVERAIQTFKSHFIAGLCTTDPEFPIQLWDRLLPQAEITINILQNSRINSKLSAYAQLNGIFDFNATLLAPPGTRVLVHKKPGNQKSWKTRGKDGWYIGPAMEHYRCYRIYIPETHSECIADTVEFFSNQIRSTTIVIDG